MGLIINSIERKSRLQITIVILIIVVISTWIPHYTDAKEYRHHITKKTSRGLTFVKSSDILLGTNFELYNKSRNKSESRIFDIPAAAGYSSADVSAGIVKQNNTTSNQSGLTVDTYPVGIAVNPVTKKIYATNELSNRLSVISEH